MLLGAVWLLCDLVACSPVSSVEDGPTIGVILDYTGTEVAGFNEEQALLVAARLMAEARIGAAPFRFVYRNARGNPEDARRAARELVEQGVDVVLGPSTDQVVPAVREVLDEADIVLVSPNPTIGDSATRDRPWFRLSPGNLTGSTTPALIGEHMAAQFFARGSRRALIVTDDDTYNLELVEGFIQSLTSRGGQVIKTLKAGDKVAQQTVTLLERKDADAVLVAASVLQAANLIWDVYSTIGQPPQWLLTPRLKSTLLLINTPVGALEGAYGVSLRIPARVCDDALEADCFSGAMQEAWGTEAFESAYFMYDAAAVVLIALERVWKESSGVVAQADLREAIFKTTERGGVRIGWNEFSTAVAAGGNVQYSGVTGSIVLTPSGLRIGGETVGFEVANHEFINVTKQTAD